MMEVEEEERNDEDLASFVVLLKTHCGELCRSLLPFGPPLRTTSEDERRCERASGVAWSAGAASASLLSPLVALGSDGGAFVDGLLRLPPASPL